MAFAWKDYGSVSRFLEQQAANSAYPEAFLRSAVSRAYYGAFCDARNYARVKLRFQRRDDGDDHGRLRERLKQGKLRGIAEKLERLRDWRNECDYRDQLKFDCKTLLGLALREASSIIANLALPNTTE